MEIGELVKWSIDEKQYQGLFIQELENGLAEIICYSMNGLKCHFRVYVDSGKLNQ